MADKGNVYRCSWKANGDGTVTGWLVRRPTLRASGKDLGEVEAELSERVGRLHNDHEAVLEFDPPLDGPPHAELFNDDFVKVAWNARFRHGPTHATAFVGGQCRECGRGLGARSETPLIVNEVSSDCDGTFTTYGHDASAGPAQLAILSQRFVALLDPAERRCLPLRQVERSGRSRAAWFEVIPTTFVPVVAKRGLELRGWRCGSCKARNFHHPSLKIGTNLIRRSDVPDPVPVFFFVGDATDHAIVTTRKHYRKLCDRPAARKMTGDLRVGVVNDTRAVLRPDVPTLKELAAVTKEYGFKVFTAGHA